MGVGRSSAALIAAGILCSTAIGQVDSPSVASVPQPTAGWLVNGSLAALDDGHPEVRSLAILSLWWLAEIPPELVKAHADEIVAMLGAEDENTRWAAAKILDHSPEAVRAQADRLVAMFEDNSRDIRRLAACVLRDSPEAVKAQANRLVAMLEDDSNDVREAAVIALAGSPELLKAQADKIITMFRESSFPFSSPAYHVLCFYPDTVAERADDVVGLLEDDSSKARAAARLIFHARPELVQAYADRLVAMLGSEDSSIRSNAACVLHGSSEAVREHADRLVAMLEDDSGNVRQAAADVLRGSPEAVKAHADRLVAMLGNEDSGIRAAAVEALGGWPEAVSSHADRFVAMLEDDSGNVRHAAVVALAGSPEAVKAHADRIVAMLDDRDRDTRAAVLRTLVGSPEALMANADRIVAMFGDNEVYFSCYSVKHAFADSPEVVKEYADKLVAMLDNRDDTIRECACSALAASPDAVREYADRLVAMLDDDEFNVREAAIEALAGSPDAVRAHADRLVAMLDDDQFNVREAAIKALAGSPDAVRVQADRLVAMLGNEDPDTRTAALEVFGGWPEAVKAHADTIVAMLRDVDPGIREVVCMTLATSPELVTAYVDEIVAMLADEDNSVREAAIRALREAHTGPTYRLVLVTLNTLGGRLGKPELYHHRFAAHVIGGGEDATERLLQRVGKPNQTAIPNWEDEDGATVYRIARDAWNEATQLGLDSLRRELASLIADVAMRTDGWQEANVIELAQLAEQFREAPSGPGGGPFLQSAASLESVLDRVRWWKAVRISFAVWLGHVIFWGVLLTLYPWDNPISRSVQATFFWNSTVRRTFGLGYVNFVLVQWPFRNILLAPFKRHLRQETGIADAEYARAAGEYFAKSVVVDAVGNTMPLVEAAAPPQKGLTVIRGDSGLGKSMYVRHAVRKSKRLCVYVAASQCRTEPDDSARTSGVVTAILQRLHGLPEDALFLQNLLHVGALDVYIDGVNEVGENVRLQIATFVDRYPHTPVVLTMQRMAWDPPSSRLLELQPLSRIDSIEFLQTRESSLPSDAPLAGDPFREKCETYLDEQYRQLDAIEDEDEQVGCLAILSNPMDLSTIAQLLACRREPSILRLPQEQYQLMAQRFEQDHRRPFPLELFSRRVLENDLESEGRRRPLPADDFIEEVQCLENHKMAYRRDHKDREDTDVREWWFRHEKIRDFFLIPAFRKLPTSDQLSYVDDPRFRGVYSLLALELPVEDAEYLGNLLVNYAARTQDSTVFARYIQLLNARKAQETRGTKQQAEGGRTS